MLKILQVNKFYYIKGGSETYFFALKDLLEQHGNQTVDFAMKDELNFDSPYRDFFVENIDYHHEKRFFTKLKLAFKIVYSWEAKRKIAALIERERPDIAHLHIFQHQLSASILAALKARKIPIMYTAHDLKAICPNYKMLCRNNVCERCKDHRYYHCFLNRCVKNSYLKSLVNTIEMYFQLLSRSYTIVDRIIVPSEFYRQKLIQFGFAADKLVYLPNFIKAAEITPSYEHRGYFIYLGRLSEEKGLKTLIKAAELVSDAKLIIIGTGPLENELKEYVVAHKLQNRIQLLGYRSGDELKELIKGAMFGVIPSEWYENNPYSLLEMMAYGKPVVGANIGGIPELIEDGRTGLVFEKGNCAELAAKISILINNPDLIVGYGKNARMKLEREFNAENHYQKLLRIYGESVARSKVKSRRLTRGA